MQTSDGRDAGLAGACCGLHQSVEFHERDAVVSGSSFISPFKVGQPESDNWQKERTELFILKIISKTFSFWFLLIDIYIYFYRWKPQPKTFIIIYYFYGSYKSNEIKEFESFTEKG